MTTHPRTSQTFRILTGALFALAALLAGPPALAHNVVEDRIPVPESTITDSPVEVSIATDDIFLDLGENQGGFAIVMMDEAGLYYGDGCVKLQERQMTASIALGSAGTYTVVYQFVSADGHSLSESYTVEFQPTEDHVETAGVPNPPVCGVEYQAPEEPPVATSPPSEIAPVDEVSSTTPRAAIPVWAWLGGPLVLTLAGGLWWLARRKTSADS